MSLRLNPYRAMGFVAAACALALSGCDDEATLPAAVVPTPPSTVIEVRPVPGSTVIIVNGADGPLIRTVAADGQVALAESEPHEIASSPVSPIASLPAPNEAPTPHASSSFGGWPVTNATDGNLETSWYSASGDSAGKGKTTYFELELPSPRTVHHVRVFGNRDPSYPKGFSILAGRLDVLDAEGRIVATSTRDAKGELHDFDFDLHGLEGVKTLRFTSLRDEGASNSWGDIAIAEFQAD